MVYKYRQQKPPIFLILGFECEFFGVDKNPGGPMILFMMGVGLPWSALDKDWYCINDTVMGGVSSSTIEKTDSGALLFSGNLSTENNGGFTSSRSRSDVIDLTGVDQIRLKVKGDGRQYYATIRPTSRNRNVVYYRQKFATKSGSEEELILPIEDFKAYAYGRFLPTYPALSSSLGLVSSVGVMLADKKDGAFSLEILSYSAEQIDSDKPVNSDKQQMPTPANVQTVQSLFSMAIDKGAPMYNSGNTEGCAAVYQTAIESVLLLKTDLGNAPKKVLQMALYQANGQNASDRAWTFRYAMDAILEMD